MSITYQELFDKMWAGLSGQGWKRAEHAGACLYVTPEGDKCAVGHCLTAPDGATFGNVCQLLHGNVDARRDLGFPEYRNTYHPTDHTDERLQFLRDSQSAHDYARSPEHMQSNLRDIAINYGLTVPQ